MNSFYFMPQSMGGLARTLDQLAAGLRERGHQVSALVELKNEGDAYSFTRRVRLRMARALGRVPVIGDRHNGYRVWRCWNTEAVLPAVIAEARPDVVVIMGGKVVPLARKVRETGVPCVIQMHDVEFHMVGGDLDEVADIPCVANSKFTAKKYQQASGAECDVVLPFINLADYETETTRERVLFVHPVAKKGVVKAAEIAQLCPEIPFTFVGKSSYEESQQELGLPAAETLPNLQVLPGMADMRQVYRSARILLAPSQWEEAYGRVVNEAQMSGIPVLASDRGGLPEAAQDGGLLLPHDAPAEQWADALRRLWNDTALYGELSDKARLSTRRRELDPDYQLDQHECLLRRTIETSALTCTLAVNS